MNREAFTAKVFSDEGERNRLNAIVHPAVKRYIIKEFEKEKQTGEHDYLILEAALLIEDHYDEICDEIWYVYADEHARRRRLKQSRGYSDDKITGMLANQRSDLSFRENCTVTIDNSSENLQNTFRQIDEALARRGVLKSVRR
jgi:dephospho-CoA kinase